MAAGLAGTLLPAFGWLPALGAARPSLDPWRELLAMPGIGRSVLLTLATGIAATLLAFAGAVLALAASQGRRRGALLRLVLPLLLAVPHLASAMGLAFLIAPSGWLARLLSPWLTGWERPPDLLTVNDPYGIALTLGLALRECPFLILALQAAQSHLPTGTMLAVARMQGHGRVLAWLKLVLPAIYPQIRLPLYAVLAFSLSVVDMALVLGPTTPPVLSVLLLRWFNDPDLTLRLAASAGAILQLVLILLAIGAWRLAERIVAASARPWLTRPASRHVERLLAAAGSLAMACVVGSGLLGIAVLAIWSLAWTWRFPAALPQRWSLDAWSQAASGLAWLAWTTLLVAVLTTLLALVLVLACLEREVRAGPKPERRVLALAYLPLLLPPVSFLFGLQIWFVRLGLDATWTGLVWTHLVFVLPYVLLLLRAPYLALDARWAAAGAALGSPPGRIFRRIRLPLLRRPLAVAAAVGLAVSVAQYLPTLVIGAGRLTTLATETLALTAGGDRRLAAVAALLLAVLPILALAAALLVPSPRLGRDHRHGR